MSDNTPRPRQPIDSSSWRPIRARATGLLAILLAGRILLLDREQGFARRVFVGNLRMRRNNELDDLRFDLKVLGRLIDALLDEGRSRDPLLQACSAVCLNRRQRIEVLEQLETSQHR